MSARFLFAVTSAIYSTNAALPGVTQDGVASIFDTVDVDTTTSSNNCAWQDSDPITDTSIFPFGNFAGVNTNFFEDAVSCGECYELECVGAYSTDADWAGCECISGATVTVMVVDYGSDVYGTNGQLDYVFDLPSSVAYEILQDTGSTTQGCDTDGSKYDIKFTQVCCDHLQDIALTNWAGITSNWLSFILTQVRGYGSITNVWFREDGRSDYYECNRNANGINKFWECDPWTTDYDNYYDAGIADGLSLSYGDDPAYSLPIDIKIMDSNGDVLESLDLITSFTPEQEFDFGDNFDAACSGGFSSSSTSSTTTAPETSTSSTSAPDTTASSTSSTTSGSTSSSTSTASTTSTSGTSSTEEAETSSTSTTTDGLGNYVDCSSVDGSMCDEAFPPGCCRKSNGNCLVADPPLLDGTCSTTTSTSTSTPSTSTSSRSTSTSNQVNMPSKANHVNIQLLASIFVIFLIVFNY